MIYLRTGANGTCKTLFTLADVRKLQLETGRPVCINSRFKMHEAKRLEFGWVVADFKDWQSQLDGTIFLIDECHNDMPVRPAGQTVPDPIRMLAEHRSRGFDFFLLSQHPMNIDSFVRKLIGAPGWHQHLKRVFGGTKSTRVLQWDAVNTNCEKDGSGKNAQISTRMQPKEVYSWYDSATLHTAKTRIPGKVWVLGVCLLLIPALFWMGFQRLASKTPPPAAAFPMASGVAPSASPALSATGAAVLTPVQFLATYAERVEGLPHTAPRYDEVTKPTIAPYPAACVSMGPVCKCYTQQGTMLQTSQPLCLQIVKNGFFQDWGGVGMGQGSSPPPASRHEPSTPLAGNPGSSPSVAVVTKAEHVATTSARDGEVFARMGRVGGGTRPVLVN